MKYDKNPILSGIYCICKYSEKIVLPTTYEINVNERATSITGTVAKPSRPSVRFTAFEEPTIIKRANGIKNIPKWRTKFLKKGKYRFLTWSLFPNFNNKIIAIKESITWKIIFKPDEIPLELFCFIFK